MAQHKQGFFEWLEEKPHRFTILNVAMLTGLLSAMGSAPLFLAIGGLSLAVSGIACIRYAFLLTFKNWKQAHPYQIALVWAPGAIALLLTACGLYLVTHYDAGSLFYLTGCTLFGFELAMLTILAAELQAAGPSINKYLETR